MRSTDTNLLISSLSCAGRARLLQDSDAISLPTKFRLYHSSFPPTHAYFLLRGLASMVSSTAEGDTTEVGLIGCEGVVGSWHVMGPAPINIECYMQVDGAALRVPLSELRAAFEGSSEIRARILEFAQCQFLTLAQLTLCQRQHDAKQRLARWLLMAADRNDSESVDLTQELLAIMLGVQRPTVTLLLAALEQEKLIICKRGRITIPNRAALAWAACECYQVVKASLDKLYSEPTLT